MKPVPVVWHSFGDNSPARGYWDQALLEWLFAREWWVPDGVSFEHHTSFDDIKPTDGVVLVTPGHGGNRAVHRINDAINQPGLGASNPSPRPRPWVLLIVTSDEEGAFPWWRITHPNMAVWRQYVDTSQTHRPDRAIPCGWTTGTRDQFADTPPPERSFVWSFAGQVTDNPEHQRRRQFIAATRHIDDMPHMLKPTGGFAHGMEQSEFRATLAATQYAPCPTGNHSPDTFRMYEALESGATPIIDAMSTKQARGYWSLVFPDGHPFVAVDRWGTVRDAINQSPTPAESLAWWVAWKRDHAWDLAGTIHTLAGDTHRQTRNPVDDITVIMPTSPIHSHPGTDVIDETIASIRTQLPHAEIIIGMDPPRPELADRYGDTWTEYVDNVVWKSNHHWYNVVPIIQPEWGHQANTTRDMLRHVHTPLVLFVEHDTPIVGDIEWARMAETVLAGDVHHMRLHYDVTIHPDHRHMMFGIPVTDESGFRYQRTTQWSQRPHMARTNWYRHIIENEFPESSRTMIEDWMHGVVENADHWDQWRLAIYAPADDDMKRSGHIDGRGGHDPKFEMEFAR